MNDSWMVCQQRPKKKRAGGRSGLGTRLPNGLGPGKAVVEYRQFHIDIKVDFFISKYRRYLGGLRRYIATCTWSPLTSLVKDTTMTSKIGISNW